MHMRNKARPIAVMRYAKLRAGTLLASLLCAQAASAAIITVNSAADTIAADGAVTLREAITSMNNGADVNSDVPLVRSGTYGVSDTIRFAVGSGPKTIPVAQALPLVIKTMTLDGTTQPGFVASALITLDGTAAGAGVSGLSVSSLTSTNVLALNVRKFAANGMRIAALDRIFADGFETSRATVALGLNNVALTQNGSAGLMIADAAVVVGAQDLVADTNAGGGVLVSAGRADISGASQINGNHGGAPVAFGVQVAPGAILTLTGANGAPIQINGNDGVGLLARGNFNGAYVETANNGAQGVWVATTDAPVFPEGGPLAQNAVLAAFDIHSNGASPGAYPGGGLTVLRTRMTTTSMSTLLSTGIYVPERFVLKEGPALSVQSRVHDNLGDGVTLGGDPTPSTGLCAIVPTSLSCGAVDGFVANTLIYDNSDGLVIQEQDTNQSATVPNVFRSYITENSGVGLHVYTSYVGFDQNANYINGNTIGHNGWPSPTCNSGVLETAPQIEFDGQVAASAGTIAACRAHASATACNLDRSHTCLWNQDIFNSSGTDPCRPSYLLSTTDCSANQNVVTGYLGTGNPDLVVGVLATSGAWVNGINASWIHGGDLMEGKDWSTLGLSSFFSDGPSGSEQTCTAAINKCPTHF